MFLDVYYPLIFSVILFFLISYQKIFFIPGLNKWDLSIAFVFKLIVSLIYLYVFDVLFGKGTLNFDSLVFFNDGIELNKVFYKSPKDYFHILTGIGEDKKMIDFYLYNTWKWSYSITYFLDDSKNIIRICSLIEFFAKRSFFIYFIIFDLIALLSVYYLTKTIYKFSTIPVRYIFYGFLFLPSFLFWTSGILKEVTLMFGFSLFLYSIYYLKTNNLKRIILFLISIIFLLTFKPYVFFILIISIIILAIKTYSKLSYINTIIIFLFISSLTFIFNYDLREQITKTISFKQHDFINVGKGGVFCYDTINKKEYSIASDFESKLSFDSSLHVKIIGKIEMFEINRYKEIIKPTIADEHSNVYLKLNTILKGSKSFIPITPIKYSTKQLILNIPSAFINTNFRPLPFDPGKKFRIPAFIETFLLFSFFTIALLYAKKLKIKEKNLIYFLSIFAVLLSILIGLTTPILGAIIRYRIPVYVSIFFISIILIDYNKLWKKK